MANTSRSVHIERMLAAASPRADAYLSLCAPRCRAGTFSSNDQSPDWQLGCLPCIGGRHETHPYCLCRLRTRADGRLCAITTATGQSGFGSIPGRSGATKRHISLSARDQGGSGERFVRRPRQLLHDLLRQLTGLRLRSSDAGVSCVDTEVC